LIIAYFER